MKVRMKVQVSGTRNGARWPGIDGELSVSNAEGAELCAQGYAEPVAAVPAEATEKRPAAKRAEKRA